MILEHLVSENKKVLKKQKEGGKSKELRNQAESSGPRWDNLSTNIVLDYNPKYKVNRGIHTKANK